MILSSHAGAKSGWHNDWHAKLRTGWRQSGPPISKAHNNKTSAQAQENFSLRLMGILLNLIQFPLKNGCNMKEIKSCLKALSTLTSAT
jgi:hypothetical protein